jgi:hypothetical protein
MNSHIDLVFGGFKLAYSFSDDIEIRIIFNPIIIVGKPTQQQTIMYVIFHFSSIKTPINNAPKITITAPRQYAIPLFRIHDLGVALINIVSFLYKEKIQFLY